MSEANVEIVRRIYKLLERDDLDAALGLMDTGIEYVNPDYAVEPGTRYGHDGIRANVENMRAAFEYWRFEPDEFFDAGDRVLVLGTFGARGRDSGVQIERRMSRIWTIRDGKAVRYQWFDNDREAFEVAGIEKPPAERPG
jgi:ketosteroid isomerase-like protein